jgi:hypothetical protein
MHLYATLSHCMESFANTSYHLRCNRSTHDSFVDSCCKTRYGSRCFSEIALCDAFYDAHISRTYPRGASFVMAFAAFNKWLKNLLS